ncbi:MAG: transcriptional regulator [Desulfobulbus propionicus]|nr:MAG: transcriptional regulator [Desulfobulbus propionicus]
MDTTNTAELAQILKSIAHPIRLTILCLLQEKELSAGELALAAHTSYANLSQHLSVLRRQGLIQTRREARYLYSRINDQRIVELMVLLNALFCEPKTSQDPDNEVSSGML